MNVAPVRCAGNMLAYIKATQLQRGDDGRNRDPAKMDGTHKQVHVVQNTRGGVDEFDHTDSVWRILL